MYNGQDMSSSELTVEAVEKKIMIETGPIPRAEAEAWMQSDDLQILGLVVQALVDYGDLERIEPRLDTQVVYDFLMRYYEHCIREDPPIEWADGRYTIGMSIVPWYHGAPETDDQPRQEFLARVKQLLARLYLEGDEDIRDAVVCGTLEHILEQPRWREFFKDWCDDPILRETYGRAMEWAVWHDEQASDVL
jgi:hypothetical protein